MFSWVAETSSSLASGVLCHPLILQIWYGTTPGKVTVFTNRVVKPAAVQLWKKLNLQKRGLKAGSTAQLSMRGLKPRTGITGSEDVHVTVWGNLVHPEK